MYHEQRTVSSTDWIGWYHCGVSAEVQKYLELRGIDAHFLVQLGTCEEIVRPRIQQLLVDRFGHEEINTVVAAWKMALQNAKVVKATRITVSFEPGRIGLSHKGGRVTTVVEDGQAERAGVQPGWQLVAIDDEECSNFDSQLFIHARSSNVPYHVTFEAEATFPEPNCELDSEYSIGQPYYHVDCSKVDSSRRSSLMDLTLAKNDEVCAENRLVECVTAENSLVDSTQVEPPSLEDFPQASYTTAKQNRSIRGSS